MSYYSDNQYKEKEDLWFEGLYFDRWFNGVRGPILDVGCATGNFIATHPDQIEGVEFDPDCLAVCKKRGFTVHALDVATALDQLPEGHYHGVYAKQIIEHLNDPLKFLKDLHRTLVPGGKVVVLTPNCPYALKTFFWDDYTHVRPLTRGSLTRLALDAGFTEFKIYTDFRTFPGLGRIVRGLKLSPEFISRLQRWLGIKSLTLILEASK
jgi:2-polyprenyl-3-methyl-5-hydroxy-6-metoxy-1,4-benzoquinol methylase